MQPLDAEIDEWKVVPVDGGEVRVRSRYLSEQLPTVVFLHGIGCSSLCYLEALDSSFCDCFNIIVPDLLGFGSSSVSKLGGLRFSDQVDAVLRLTEAFGVGQFHLVGHSMGGDIGTLISEREPSRVLSLVNIEGSLTPLDNFISGRAVAAEERGEFSEWFYSTFQTEIVKEWADQWPSCRRFLASLAMCSPSAFVASAKEIVEINGAADADDGLGFGRRFLDVPVRKVYCWGRQSVSEGSVTHTALLASGIPNQCFDSFHWVMIDDAEDFYSFLRRFICERP